MKEKSLSNKVFLSYMRIMRHLDTPKPPHPPWGGYVRMGEIKLKGEFDAYTRDDRGINKTFRETVRRQ